MVKNKRNIARTFLSLIVSLLSFGVASPASAHIIDRVEINQVGDEAEIQVIFDVRIHYLREASLKNGEIHIFFELLENDPDRDRLVPESKDSPPSDITPHFTVAFPVLDSSMAVTFDAPVKYRVRAGRDGRSISIFTPVVKPKSESQSVATPPMIVPPLPVVPLNVPGATVSPPAAGEVAQPVIRTQEDIEAEAKQFIASARDAIQHNQLEAAIETLNRLLLLPPNQQSQSAQELIGEAREKNGEITKARAEYGLYIELYPKAADITQVKDRLAHLPAEAVKSAQAAPIVAKQKFVEEKMVVYGGISQYYYKGVSHTDTFAIQSDLTTLSSSGTVTDQSQLLSLLDMTARKRTENTDTRLVLRENYNANFLAGQANDNRLNDLYVEQSARDRRYLYRLGRQTGSTGGAPGRFDGAFAGYELNQMWRVNGVIGTPVEYVSSGGSTGPRKIFSGVSVDLTRLPDQWSGSGYYIQQRVESFVDRSAVGLETHYFDMQQNYMGLFEYDTVFKKVNLGMFQGNWTTRDSTNYNLLIDHRRSPPLQLTNALMGQSVQSVDALVQSGVPLKTLREDSQALSPISNLYSVGMNRAYSPRWRLGTDFRISNTSGTGGTSTITSSQSGLDIYTGQPASTGSGNIYTISFNALGNNLFLENDLGVANASYTSARTYSGQTLTYTQVETFRQNWRTDMSLLLYNQNDNLGTHQTQIRPSFKLSYRVNNSFNLEGEGGVELFHTSSATQDNKSRRKYFYVGYRWDFQ